MENLTIDHGTNSILCVFDNYIKEDEFKQFAKNILNKVQTSGKTKLLYDTRGLKVMPQSIQDWINEVWFPEANKIGVSHMAFIVPDNIFGKVSMEQTNSQKDKIGNISIQYFNSQATAQKWIKDL
ncbi:MAG: STAS/SEC14 domain-containing protein [Bacteroidales bacterium]|nr:STAS/SEC14 domain-containing protein [Bacteroidales bacterium]